MRDLKWHIDLGCFHSELFLENAVVKMVSELVHRCDKKWSATGDDVEYCMLLLLTHQDSKPLFMGYAQPFTPAANVDSQVLLVGAAPRPSPTIKSSQWAKDRIKYQARLKAPVLEAILYDPDGGDIYEGLLTNFYVITRDDSNRVAVMTAPRGTVLEGTSCWMVEQVCDKLGIQFIRKHPSIRDADVWEGAFITSALRTCHSVSVIHLDDASRTVVRLPTDQHVLDRMRNELLQSLHSFSTQI
ncbi:hypothetical protein SeMB42_g03989 [Synchytrium endobioticum]|uniref:Branched-chain-amino-acid transaminase n=1 Tax=Synchytrium endobioticum TaxID=286115 RepID=A0A507CYV0_9FUNG|nr:hypothetical protein SeLEV6574_g04561 [Synchytrium endobioticum]TPX45481.1 hypothetical protein SeMB42_g03989 [Synchytrium endobioticum]